MEVKVPINVACAIIEKEGLYLAACRSEKMSLPLKWEFPGGKLSANESAEECILREIKEELNINIRIIGRLSDCLYDYGNFSINLIPFVTKYIDGELLLQEHKEVKWLGLDQLHSLDWAAADIPVLNELMKKINA